MLKIQLYSRAFLRNYLTRFSLVVPQRLGGPENFVARVARIFETLNVLLSVLFHVTFATCFEVTFDTSEASIDEPFKQRFNCIALGSINVCFFGLCLAYFWTTH